MSHAASLIINPNPKEIQAVSPVALWGRVVERGGRNRFFPPTNHKIKLGKSIN